MADVTMPPKDYEELKQQIQKAENAKAEAEAELKKSKDFVRQILGKVPVGMEKNFIENIIPSTLKLEMSPDFNKIGLPTYKVLIMFEIKENY